jgi:hypothetical protein
MRYSTFEQAAAEASAGLQEIDAEIQRLSVKRDLLATLAEQLSAALPAIAEAFPDRADAVPENPPAEHAYAAHGAAEEHATSSYSDMAPYSADASPYAADAAPYSTEPTPEPEAAAVPEKSLAEMLAQSKTFSLRNEGWPATTAVDQRGLRQLL